MLAVHTLADLEAEAVRFADSLAPISSGATLITLSGELGAGKTAFTKAAARFFGIEETVTSPTFVLEKIYLLPEGKSFKRLIHIDAYRLESGSELAPLGFHELLTDPFSVIFLEWPEKVTETLPVPAKKIFFTVESDGTRTIRYE